MEESGALPATACEAFSAMLTMVQTPLAVIER